MWRALCDLDQTGCHGDHVTGVVLLRILEQDFIFTCGVVYTEALIKAFEPFMSSKVAIEGIM